MGNSIPLESKITKDIMAWLKSSGYYAVKIHGAAYQTAGLPDIIALDSKGRMVGLEVKRPVIGKVTELQKRTLEEINLHGGYAVVVRSVEDAAAAIAASEDKKSAFFIDPGAR